MRKLIKVGTTIGLIILFIIYLIANHDGGHHGSLAAGFILLGGYSLVLALLGAWKSLDGWENMGGVRKFFLFLVALPAIIMSLELLIFLLLIPGFLADAGGSATQSIREFDRQNEREQRRQEFRSDIRSAIDDEFKKRGY